jgi:hypothetical protein
MCTSYKFIREPSRNKKRGVRGNWTNVKKAVRGKRGAGTNHKEIY